MSEPIRKTYSVKAEQGWQASKAAKEQARAEGLRIRTVATIRQSTTVNGYWTVTLIVDAPQ